MSTPSGSASPGRLQWLPARLRPRDAEDPGTGELRLVETTLVVLVAVLLAVATVNDVVRQTHINDRLVADLNTWRAYTGHAYHNLQADQQLFGVTSKREVVCGNTSPGAPRARTQLCLAIWGPVRDGRRIVHGGWYLPPRSEDQRRDRYGCFGSAVAEEICPR
jgi:hypothetical protein